MSRWFGVWYGAGEQDTHDTVAPSIDLDSPVSFTSTSNPVIIDVTDSSPGLRTTMITVTGAGWEGVQVAYYDGSFVSPFTTDSTASASAEGIQFSLLPTGGWFVGNLTVTVETVDQDGNRALESFSWVVPADSAVTNEGNPGYPFRDSVWRWRRRLNRQKCSVISVAIEDNYSDGPGFTLTALALEVGKKTGLDRIPWRGGTGTNRSGTATISNGDE